jgi:tetratricopeptide (TPR) repeat protein
MILAQTENRDSEGLAFARKASERLDTLLESESLNEKEAPTASRILSNMALTHSNVHLVDEAVRYARRSVEITRRYGNDQRYLSAGLSVLANATRFAGDLEGALQAVREARAIAQTMAGSNDSIQILNLAAAFWREGLILGELNNINLDRTAEAVPLIEKAFDLAEGLAAKDPDDYSSRTYVSMAGRELGDMLRDSDPAQALAVYDRTRGRVAEIKNNPKARRDEVWLLAGSSYALRRLGRPRESRQRIDAAFAILGGLKDYPADAVSLGDEVDVALRALGDHYADTGQTAAGITTYKELLEKVHASNPQPETDLRHANGLSRIYRDLANLHRRAGDAAQAGLLDQQRLALWQFWDRKLPDNAFVRRQLAAASVGS